MTDTPANRINFCPYSRQRRAGRARRFRVIAPKPIPADSGESCLPSPRWRRRLPTGDPRCGKAGAAADRRPCHTVTEAQSRGITASSPRRPPMGDENQPAEISGWPKLVITYRTDPDKVAALLPPGIEPGAEPIVTIGVYCVPIL
ncbi:MAG: acetoacetate decarboxylase family protein, partial [Actinomycetota bacterium]|nr:acetoacetate decarboxylase family protein [Actinomycetota bacterium]